MRYGRNLNPEWGYMAPAPSVMRTVRLIAIATIIGATVGAWTVFSSLDRPLAEESVAARTMIEPDPKPVTTNGPVAPQQRGLQEFKLPADGDNSAEQRDPELSPAAPAYPQPSELATTSRPQHPAAALAEAPAVKEASSAPTSTDTIGVEPAPAPKPRSRRMPMTSRTAPRTVVPRTYERFFDEPRYRHEPRYGYESRYGSSGSSAWGAYY
jgi:hypothetical protein